MLAQRDPQLCHHYTKDIYAYLRELELAHRVSPHFMQVRQAAASTLAAFTCPDPLPVAGCSPPRRPSRARRLTPRSPPPSAPQGQRDINATMRGILIDWLVEVAEEYRLEAETLFLAVNYIDRFLSYVPVNRSKLQLVGVTCMLIASKYEEIHPPVRRRPPRCPRSPPPPPPPLPRQTLAPTPSASRALRRPRRPAPYQ